jgi:hypothetical protein
MSLLERCREAKRSGSYPLADARGSEVNCNREVSEGNRDRQEAAFDLLGRARASSPVSSFVAQADSYPPIAESFVLKISTCSGRLRNRRVREPA